ncbi:MAG: MBL fold metallo-hydrolase [Verrucomicrobiota bacterium]
MRIETFELPPIGTNAYLLTDDDRKEAILIDAPQMAWERVSGVLDGSGINLVAVLLTHGHFDHVMGASAFNRQGTPVYAHADDREMMSKLKEQVAMFGIPTAVDEPQIDHWFDTSKPLELLGRSIDIRHTPGHCPGNVTLVFPEEKAAFVGDVIFAGGIGRTDLPGGSFPVLERSIKEQIYTLPPETTIFPGHGPTSTVDHERLNNPFVLV